MSGKKIDTYPLSARLSSSLSSLSPPLRWAGGKQKMSDEIIDKMPPHKTYVEPFAGSASIYFAKPLAEKNVINDVNKGLINFYKELKNDKSCKKLSKCKSPDNIDKFHKLQEKKDTDACAFLGVHRKSFGGSPIGGFTDYPDAKTDKIEENCDEYQKKLSMTKILNEDYKKVFKDHDSKDTLTYMDPPYHEIGTMYGTDIPNPKDVCDLARGAKGKVMISYNNHPEVRKSCKGLNIGKISTTYTMSKDSKKVKELLITNY